MSVEEMLAEETGVATQSLVLRVLSGGNAGAELPLSMGDWLIGAGEDADLTFSEPALLARHVRLHLGTNGVRAEILAEGVRVGGRAVPAEVQITLAPLVAVQIGTTRFAVGGAESDWSRVAQEAETPADDAEAAAQPAPEGPGEATPAGPEPEIVAGPRPERFGATWRRRPVPRLFLLAVPALLLLGAAGLAWHAWGSADPAAPLAHSEPLRELRRVVGELGLQDSVSVAPRNRGGFVVSGQLGMDKDLERLTAALRRTGLPFDIAVTTETRLTELSETILHAFGIDGSVAVTGIGTLQLAGFAPSSSAADSATGRIRAEIPGVRNVQDGFVTPERARDVIEARIRSAGLQHSLRVTANGRKLSVSGLVPPEQVVVWAGIAEQFRKDYGRYIDLATEIAGPAEVAPRGVVLGRTPSLVMEDGRRIRVGQTVENVGRILSIDTRRVRVQTPAGPVDIPFSRNPSWIMEDHDAPSR